MNKLATATKTEEGWLIVDVTRRNDDPHQMDDCWHRGAYTVYAVRGTQIRVEEEPSDGIGDTYDRLMNAVLAASYVGYMEFIHGKGMQLDTYRVIQTNETYTPEWLATRQAEMKEWEAKYPPCEYDYCE